MKYLLIALVVLMLIPTGGITYGDDFCCEDRWQFRYHALLWDFTTDRIETGPNEYLGLYLDVPDEACHKGLGGITGSIKFAFHANPVDTNFVIYAYEGKWSDGSWVGQCIPVEMWSSSTLERP